MSILNEAIQRACRQGQANPGDRTGAARSFVEDHADADGWTLQGHNPAVTRIRELAAKVDMSRNRVRL